MKLKNLMETIKDTNLPYLLIILTLVLALVLSIIFVKHAHTINKETSQSSEETYKIPPEQAIA